MKIIKYLDHINSFLEKRVESRWVLAMFIWCFVFIPFLIIYEPICYFTDSSLKERRESLRKFRQGIQIGDRVVVSLRECSIIGRVHAIPTKWSKLFIIEYGKYNEVSDTYSIQKKFSSSKIYAIHQTAKISDNIENC